MGIPVCCRTQDVFPLWWVFFPKNHFVYILYIFIFQSLHKISQRKRHKETPKCIVQIIESERDKVLENCGLQSVNARICRAAMATRWSLPPITILPKCLLKKTSINDFTNF